MTKRAFVVRTIAAAGLAVAMEHAATAQSSCHATPYWVSYPEGDACICLPVSHIHACQPGYNFLDPCPPISCT